MKNHKQRIICFCPTPIRRVRYYYQTCPVWIGTKRKCFCSTYSGRVRYCRNQNTNWITTESLIHIFSYILNLLKQNKHRANKGRICYACRKKGHLSYECPNGNAPKPNIFVYNDMLRKTTNGVSTSKVMCSPQTSTSHLGA